jgi:hypothetical protein
MRPLNLVSFWVKSYAAVVPGILAQSTHLEPNTVCEINESVGLSLLPEPLVARLNFSEVCGAGVEIESEVYSGVKSRANSTIAGVEDESLEILKLRSPCVYARQGI